MTSDRPAAAPGSWWRCRAVADGGRPAWFALVASTAFADEEVVELPEAEALRAVGDAAEGVARFDDTGAVVRLEPGRRFSPDAARLWYAEVPQPTADPPASHLVAFEGHDVEPGSLVTREQLATSGVTSDDQVAAMRWIPLSGQAHQLYVQPAWRRRGIATGIGVACAVLQAARGGPRVWGDGSRTAMGEKWREGTDWAHLAAELEYLEAPMTPYDQR